MNKDTAPKSKRKKKMAYVFMRNVRHVLQPISSLSSVSLQQQVKGVQSLKKILSLQYQQSFPRANFSASTFLQNSSPAAVTSENDASITKQGQQNNGVAHNNQTHKEQHTKNTVKLNTAKTKEAHRKRFHNAIEKGIYNTFYNFIIRQSSKNTSVRGTRPHHLKIRKPGLSMRQNSGNLKLWLF